jgi:transcriptional regulator with XRE-family HTH domain
MALFFDAQWFDARLAERGLTRAALAAASGMSEADLALVYKDQRELSAAEVAAFAEVLGVTPAQVALNAGVSTPVPETVDEKIAALEAELARLKGG